MTEYTINTDRSFDDVMKRLNRVFLKIDRAVRNNKSFKCSEKILPQLKKSSTFLDSSKSKSDAERDGKIAQGIYKEIYDLYDDKSDKDLSTGKSIFDVHRINIQPMEGEGTFGKAFYNEKLIIGARIQFPDGRMSYRVDYDKVKGLHFNFEMTISERNKISSFGLALVVTPITRRYFVEMPTEKNSESKQLELVKFKAFVKMTLAYLLRRPTQRSIDAKLMENDDPLLIFLQRKPFNLNDLKKILLENFLVLADESATQALKECKDEKNLNLVLQKYKTLRDALVESTVQSFAKYALRYKPSIEDSEDGPATDTSEESKNVKSKSSIKSYVVS